MSNVPEAPPIYRPVMLPEAADAGTEASAAAAAGADPATLFWVDRGDRAQCAVVLSPEQPLHQAAQMTVVGMTALGDALGAILPPMVVVGCRLPGAMLLNDAKLGVVQVIAPAQCAADVVPNWLVVAIDIGVTRFAEGSDKAADLSVTTFEDESCMGITVGATTGAFARYLLTWIDRWQTDGFDPVRTSWTTRGDPVGQEIELQLPGRACSGRFTGLSDAGDVLIEGENDKSRIAAADLLVRWEG